MEGAAAHEVDANCSQSNDVAVKEGFAHAWDWFSLHAGQRMQTFNFFLVAVTFLVAGYGATLEKHPLVALAIGILGAWISLWFNRLDRRTRQLIKAGEAALGPWQRRLKERSGVDALTILDIVEIKAPWTSSYSRVIAVIQWSMVIVFLLGAAYAICAVSRLVGDVAV